MPGPKLFTLTSSFVNNIPGNSNFTNVNLSPILTFHFSNAIDHGSVGNAFSLTDHEGSSVSYSTSFENHDSSVVIRPSASLKPLTAYLLKASTGLQSQDSAHLKTAINLNFTTSIDSSDKFPRISDSALLTLVEQQTFKYFWDFGHPVSGLARERMSSNDVVTTGGTGFGVMAILVGAQRNFITRVQALSRITTIVNFYANNVTPYHGAFPHWINGATGATIPFSSQDDGGDLVETAYLMQGLLTARQYFSSTTDADEINLRNRINILWKQVDWNWYRQNGQNTLCWHWSPNFNWSTNQQINGWNEAMITYVLAASSPTDSVSKIVYDNGWANNGNMRNGNSFFGIPLPLGPDYGGPLFFSHYSFLGINPNGLSDAYANYWTQDTAHARINYLYCVNNPGHFAGYSNSCWGLTASDEQNGYDAHSPTNDKGVITPTAAISSLPYTPQESMSALRFFYYKLGDKIWGQYGFIDAFNLTNVWYDSDFLAIDQGPQIIMIENYRSSLLWNLFMSCPEIKSGMKKLGFQSPYL
ncbi:MAG: beta-glucosidase [Bacteroidetes bacterium]|nr:MAG: beta-glucosidase [Bacteroidota bacterium]